MHYEEIKPLAVLFVKREATKLLTNCFCNKMPLSISISIYTLASKDWADTECVNNTFFFFLKSDQPILIIPKIIKQEKMTTISSSMEDLTLQTLLITPEVKPWPTGLLYMMKSCKQVVSRLANYGLSDGPPNVSVPPDVMGRRLL